MSFRLLQPALIAAVACLLASCSASPEKYFPDFPSKKGTLGDIVLLQDVFLVEGTATEIVKFDAVWNRRMGDSMLIFLIGECSKREYPLSRTLLASMGMPFVGRSSYSVVFTEEEQECDVEDLSSFPPPFYIDAEIDSSDEARQQWKHICRSLLQTPFQPEATHTIIPEASEFGNRLNASTMFICLATGITVPAGERARDVHMHPNTPSGYIADEKISQASITLYVIDTQSGELLWCDQNVIKGGTVYLGKMDVLLQRVLNRLP